MILTQEVSSILNDLKERAAGEDVVERISRLEVAGSGKMIVKDKPDMKIEQGLRANIKFPTRLKPAKRQLEELKKQVDYLNSAGKHFDYEESKTKLSGYTDSEVLSDRLGEEAVRYIERAMIYRDIARSIMKSANSDIEKVQRLLEWTFVNIADHFEIGLKGGILYNDFNDNPLELALRGMGACDRSAWVFATLAFYGGFETHLVYLYANPDPTSTSSHTVAEIKIANRWRVVDPINNMISERGVAELSEGGGGDYKDCTIFVNPVEAESLLPIMRLAEMVCSFYISDQKLFFDAKCATDNLVRDISSRGVGQHSIQEVGVSLFSKVSEGRDVTPAPYHFSVKRWDYPLWLRAFNHAGMFQHFKDRNFPFLKLLREMRMMQLLGQYAEAEELADSLVMGNSKIRVSKIELDYFRILNKYLKGEHDLVENAVRDFRSKFPNSPRNNRVLAYMLEQCIK